MLLSPLELRDLILCCLKVSAREGQLLAGSGGYANVPYAALSNDAGHPMTAMRRHCSIGAPGQKQMLEDQIWGASP